MRKPFRIVDVQIGLLNSRGVDTDEGTGAILLSEGCYSVVNGCKTPFIDAAGTTDANPGLTSWTSTGFSSWTAS